MTKHIAAISLLALTFAGCKTASTSANGADLAAAKAGKEKRFVCSYDADKTSKSFRPKLMVDSIEVTIVTNTLSSVSMEIGPKGSTPTKASLKSISGDEGYTEYKVEAAVAKKYGFDYVNVSYDEEDESQTPTEATLINGGSFSTCVASKKK